MNDTTGRNGNVSGNRPGGYGFVWAAWGILAFAAVVLGWRVLAGGGGLGTAVVAALVGAALLLVTVFLAATRRFQAAPGSDELPDGRLTMKPLDYLVSLLNVSRAVSGDRSAADLYQIIVDSCVDCFDCEEASIMMLDRASQELEVTAFAGHRDAQVVRKARVPLGQGVAGTVAQTRTPLILGPQVETKRFPGFQEKQRRIHCSMVAPILVRGKVVGVLNVSTGNPSVYYREDDLRVLCILAEHAGIVVAKSQDHKRVMRLIHRIRTRARRAAAQANSGSLSDRRAA